jgi:hypothetical protein
LLECRVGDLSRFYFPGAQHVFLQRNAVKASMAPS